MSYPSPIGPLGLYSTRFSTGYRSVADYNLDPVHLRVGRARDAALSGIQRGGNSSGYSAMRERDVNTWGFPKLPRNHSRFESALDPAARIEGVRNAFLPSSIGYSSTARSYNPVAPTCQSGREQSAGTYPRWSFNLSRLPQTRINDLGRKEHLEGSSGVSLSATINPIVKNMGSISSVSTGDNLGTCALIAHNLVLVPRHVIEDRTIRMLQVTFGLHDSSRGVLNYGSTYLDLIVEQSEEYDYVVAKIKDPLGDSLGCVPLSGDHIVAEPALLHYPLGRTLRASVHTVASSEWMALRNVSYHDSDYASSGGAYINPEGKMVAMHLGSEMVSYESMHLQRYALPLSVIAAHLPNSILGKLISGKLSQGVAYGTSSLCRYLPPCLHNYLIDKEGYESEKILSALFAKELKTDKKIITLKNGKVSTSKDNMSYISKTYPIKFANFQNQCLRKVGEHRKTNLYSVLGYVDSDHTLPHDVWKSTKNAAMQKVCSSGTGKRKGEKEMPAVTIPHSIHEKLLTTGSSTDSKAFRKKLTQLCDQNRVDDALILCYRDYENKGLKLSEYNSQIKNSLSQHVTLGLITASQRQKIIKAVL